MWRVVKFAKVHKKSRIEDVGGGTTFSQTKLVVVACKKSHNNKDFVKIIFSLITNIIHGFRT